MSHPDRRIRLARHQARGIGWELAIAGPHPRLQRHVLGYPGYREFAGCTPGGLARRRLPEGGGFAVSPGRRPLATVREDRSGENPYNTSSAEADSLG